MRKKEPPPKTSLEIAMEKLRRKDSEAGITPAHLTDAQKKEIAGIRTVYGAKLAEREILFRSELTKARRRGSADAAGAAEAIHKVEDAWRRDRSFIESEMESKIRAVREGGRKKKN